MYTTGKLKHLHNAFRNTYHTVGIQQYYMMIMNIHEYGCMKMHINMREYIMNERVYDQCILVHKDSLTYSILDFNRRSFVQKELQGPEMAFLGGYT